MQREKLYNLHPTTYFIGALYVFIMDKLLSVKVLPWEKDNFFDTERIHFLLFHRSITKILYQKKSKIHHKMQREKLYNLHSKADCNWFSTREKFCAINFCNAQNVISQSFVHFENKKCNYGIGGLM